MQTRSGKRLRSDWHMHLGRDRLLDATKIPPSLSATAVHNETASGLLRLPPEIRARILKHAIGHRHIRVSFAPPRRGTSFGFRCFGADLAPGYGFYTPRGVRLPSVSGVLRTCRRIYQEACLLHLAENVFSFDCDWLMNRWLHDLKPVQRRALASFVEPRPLYERLSYASLMPGVKTVYLDEAVGQAEQVKGRVAFWKGRGVSVEYYNSDSWIFPKKSL